MKWRIPKFLIVNSSQHLDIGTSHRNSVCVQLVNKVGYKREGGHMSGYIRVVSPNESEQ